MVNNSVTSRPKTRVVRLIIASIVLIVSVQVSMARCSKVIALLLLSANNTACLDINMYDDELKSAIIPTVNCEAAIPSPVAHEFFCRKIVQTIFHPHRDSEVRVTRGCGWVRHSKDC
ncbi:unnamed protein product, partial [Leptidea sinapis]